MTRIQKSLGSLRITMVQSVFPYNMVLPTVLPETLLGWKNLYACFYLNSSRSSVDLISITLAFRSHATETKAP